MRSYRIVEYKSETLINLHLQDMIYQLYIEYICVYPRALQQSNSNRDHCALIIFSRGGNNWNKYIWFPRWFCETNLIEYRRLFIYCCSTLLIIEITPNWVIHTFQLGVYILKYFESKVNKFPQRPIFFLQFVYLLLLHVDSIALNACSCAQNNRF